MNLSKIALLFIFAVLAGCQSGCKNLAATESGIQKTGNLPLASQWIIESFAQKGFQNCSKSSYITIEANLKSFTGKGTCNNIYGSMSQTGKEIRFEKISCTKMFCDNMQQEELFT